MGGRSPVLVGNGETKRSTLPSTASREQPDKPWPEPGACESEAPPPKLLVTRSLLMWMHRDARTRAQREAWVEVDAAARHEGETVALRHQRDHELHFDQRESAANAATRPAAEWEIGEARAGR
jgi:hypothetical protein